MVIKMDDNRISKHMEFKEGIKTYKEYLAKLNSVAKKSWKVMLVF